MTVKEMIKKEIDKLPENMLVEVYDFVSFLETKKERELLTQASRKISETSFEKIWNNEEDSAYDKL
ncbi:MAG: toxin-antitoxin system, antitoxin component, Xre family protein [Candidatus Brocadiaceae bacterium]|nr:toxin-antitoxin system, antitoxin component, Xre family protein [Candidatus Brocadiaceae bacterium]